MLGSRVSSLHLFTGSDFHTPRQRQFVITISGSVEITCAGGSRVFGPGDVLFASPSRAEITQAHIATESVKLSDAVVEFWCENLR